MEDVNHTEKHEERKEQDEEGIEGRQMGLFISLDEGMVKFGFVKT